MHGYLGYVLGSPFASRVCLARMPPVPTSIRPDPNSAPDRWPIAAAWTARPSLAILRRCVQPALGFRPPTTSTRCPLQGRPICRFTFMAQGAHFVRGLKQCRAARALPPAPAAPGAFVSFEFSKSNFRLAVGVPTLAGIPRNHRRPRPLQPVHICPRAVQRAAAASHTRDSSLLRSKARANCRHIFHNIL